MAKHLATQKVEELVKYFTNGGRANKRVLAEVVTGLKCLVREREYRQQLEATQAMTKESVENLLVELARLHNIRFVR